MVRIGLYRNGILVLNGPLRPWNMRESKLLMRDLVDGYFPYEFKDTYPDGILLKLEVKLEEDFGPGMDKLQVFGGVGHRVGTGIVNAEASEKEVRDQVVRVP